RSAGQGAASRSGAALCRAVGVRLRAAPAQPGVSQSGPPAAAGTQSAAVLEGPVAAAGRYGSCAAVALAALAQQCRGALGLARVPEHPADAAGDRHVAQAQAFIGHGLVIAVAE